MADDEVKTEKKSVQALRGMEARTVTKWEEEGWRLISQSPGKLRTELTFERERPKVSKKALIGAAAVLVVIAIIISIGVITERGGTNPTTAAPPSTAAPNSVGSTTAAEPTTPAAPKSAEADPLTVGKSKDLAALLKAKTNCEDSIGTFADKYQDRSIQFDGVVAAIALHGSRKTRYDILIVPNKADSGIGPTFQYVDVSPINDLGWTGSDTPDSVAVGTKLRFTATVGAYNADNCLFHLHPVATSTR